MTTGGILCLLPFVIIIKSIALLLLCSPFKPWLKSMIQGYEMDNVTYSERREGESLVQAFLVYALIITKFRVRLEFAYFAKTENFLLKVL